MIVILDIIAIVSVLIQPGMDLGSERRSDSTCTREKIIPPVISF